MAKSSARRGVSRHRDARVAGEDARWKVRPELRRGAPIRIVFQILPVLKYHGTV